MNAVEVSTVVHAPREEIYDFLVDFTDYGRYSEYVEEIERTGDGGPGTEYAITVSWWKLNYTANSEVTATDPPARIDWRLAGSIDAQGHWRIEDVDDGGDVDENAENADGRDVGENAERNDGDESGNEEGVPTNRVVLRIEYDPDSVSGSTVSLPAFVPLDAVIDRVAPHVESEAESIVEEVVADLEGERRDVELTVHEKPESV